MNTIEYEKYHEQKAHGNPRFPYTTYLCSIPLDFQEVPTHWHNEIELIYVKKGSGTIYVNFTKYDITAPAIFLIMPGQLHSIEQFQDQTMEYENIIFHSSMFEGVTSDTVSKDYIWPILHGHFNIPVVFTPDNPNYSKITAPIDACDEICKTKPAGYELYIKSQLFYLFYLLIEQYKDTVSDSKNQKRLDKIKPILKYIEKHYPEKITIAAIAAETGFSEAHFMRFFKEAMGVTFISYLNHYRLTMAARLLQGSDDSILEISEKVGFQNLSHFNRAFKKKYAITPSKHRQKQSTGERPPVPK